MGSVGQATEGELGIERVSTEEEGTYLAESPLLLRTVVTIMVDRGFRPGEVYRPRWEANYREGRLIVHKGKTKAARRSVQ